MNPASTFGPSFFTANPTAPKRCNNGSPAYPCQTLVAALPHSIDLSACGGVCPKEANSNKRVSKQRIRGPTYLFHRVMECARSFVLVLQGFRLSSPMRCRPKTGAWEISGLCFVHVSGVEKLFWGENLCQTLHEQIIVFPNGSTWWSFQMVIL